MFTFKLLWIYQSTVNTQLEVLRDIRPHNDLVAWHANVRFPVRHAHHKNTNHDPFLASPSRGNPPILIGEHLTQTPRLPQWTEYIRRRLRWSDTACRHQPAVTTVLLYVTTQHGYLPIVESHASGWNLDGHATSNVPSTMSSKNISPSLSFNADRPGQTVTTPGWCLQLVESDHLGPSSACEFLRVSSMNIGFLYTANVTGKIVLLIHINWDYQHATTTTTGSRLKVLRNKCYYEFLPSKLVFPPHSPPPNLTYFPEYVRNPDEIPSVQCDILVFEWLAMIVLLLLSLFISGWVSQVLEHDKTLFFLLRERRWESNPRPHCS